MTSVSESFLGPSLALGLAIMMQSAFASATPDEASKLGGPLLTPIGAERGGNSDGTIPSWTGGLTAAIPGYRPGEFHPDPYRDDPVLFTIDADNLAQYADKLSAGQQALLIAYPETWRMNVYPSHRSAAYPEFVYQAVKTNSRNSELIEEGMSGVRHSNVSSAFPIPKSGVEVLWNHNLRWRGISVTRTAAFAPVTGLGNYRVVLAHEEIAFPYGHPGPNPLKTKHPDVLVVFKQKFLAPQLVSGRGGLSALFTNLAAHARRDWVYSVELRRVFRTPFNGFDRPAPNTDSLRYQDEQDMFNDSPERFDWKLLGKREMYIPYNAYRLHSGKLHYKDILQRSHINPVLARYELHRVWVIEGILKSEEKHAYSRRVFYLDEDSWQIALADNYDSQGRLWRVSEGHMINYYEVPVPWYTLNAYYDLRSRRYLAEGLDNQRAPYKFSDELNPRRFSPNALLNDVR